MLKAVLQDTYIWCAGYIRRARMLHNGALVHYPMGSRERAVNIYARAISAARACYMIWCAGCIPIWDQFYSTRYTPVCVYALWLVLNDSARGLHQTRVPTTSHHKTIIIWIYDIRYTDTSGKVWLIRMSKYIRRGESIYASAHARTHRLSYAAETISENACHSHGWHRGHESLLEALRTE